MRELNLPATVNLREIKSQPLSAEEVDRIAKKAGSYEAIFSKRARLFRSLGLHEKELNEDDYRKYLLEDYTFLKRPVLETDQSVVVGNSKKSVEAMAALSSSI
jgi:arsenate reductase